MKQPLKRLLFWSPRILCILFALFLSLFALDVFDGKHGFWKTMLALLIHLIPVFALVLVLAVTWRWEWIGAVVFPALGVMYILLTHGKFHWLVYLMIPGPLFLLGALFLVNWRYRAQLRGKA